MHEGHRQRMLSRLERSHETLSDHELLEILLFNAIPRKNTNAIAHDLIHTFGSLQGVFDAEISQLVTVDGVGASTAAFLKCISYCTQRGDGHQIKGRPVLKNFDGFKQHLYERFRRETQEIVELYALDAKYHLLQTKRFTNGAHDYVAVSPKQIGAFLVHTKANALVIAHNHLTGSSAPSPEDHIFTGKALVISRFHEVQMLDHVIFSQNDTYSYFLTGELERIMHSMLLKEIAADENAEKGAP